MNPDQVAMATLNGLGWHWRADGVEVMISTDMGVRRVFIPLRYVWIAFRPMFAKSDQAVGCPSHAVGLFGFIRRAARNVARTAQGAYKTVVPKRIRRAAARVHSLARQGLKIAHGAFTSRTAQAIVAGLGVAVPVLAPAAGAVLAAQELARHVDTGLRVARAVERGFKPTPRQQLAMNRAKQAMDSVSNIATQAKAGNTAAQQLLGAFAQIAAT